MASINPKTGLLTFRLEKEGYDHVPDFCLLHHPQTVAMGASVWRRATPLRYCPDQGRRRNERELGP